MEKFILLNDEDFKRLLDGEKIEVSMQSECASASCGYIPIYIQKEDAFKISLKDPVGIVCFADGHIEEITSYEENVSGFEIVFHTKSTIYYYRNERFFKHRISSIDLMPWGGLEPDVRYIGTTDIRSFKLYDKEGKNDLE